MAETAAFARLDVRVAELAARYRPLAALMLAEVIRIPADFVDKPRDEGGECVDLRELQHAIAFLARFPSIFAAAH
jgi:hypothetical protein